MPDIYFQQAESYHFNFQKGIYLSDRYEIKDAVVIYSDLIEDFFWNYATQIRAQSSSVNEFVSSVEIFLRERKRMPCFYITPWSEPKNALEKELRLREYTVQLRDSWMFFDQSSQVSTRDRRDSEVLDVTFNENHEDFASVFTKVYGGEPTPDEPYGGLPETYVEALRRSFGLKKYEQIFNFIGYQPNGKAVSIATLIYRDQWGAIYNVGTLPGFRGKGFGTQISNACIAKWAELGGKSLFLQTETDSIVESWYRTLGFTTRFVGEGWVLE